MVQRRRHELTPPQKRVLGYILQKYTRGDGNPTIREIAKVMGYKNFTSARDVLNALVKKRQLVKVSGKAGAYHLNINEFEITIRRRPQ